MYPFFFKVQWPLFWRTQQTKTDAWRSLDFMPFIIIHLYGTYTSGSVLSTLQKWTHLILTTSLWCKGCHGPHFTDQEERLEWSQMARLKRSKMWLHPGRLAPEPLLFATMRSCFFSWSWETRSCLNMNCLLHSRGAPECLGPARGQSKADCPWGFAAEHPCHRLSFTSPNPRHSLDLSFPSLVLSNCPILGSIQRCHLAYGWRQSWSLEPFCLSSRDINRK